MNDCLFCKIINKSVPSEIVYEDDRVIAFLDVNPVNPGHVLVVPKFHAEQLLELPEDEILPSVRVVKKVMKAQLNQPEVEGINLVQNNYAAAGQVVPHVHFHVIPRKVGDGHRHWPGIAYKPGEAALVAAMLRDSIK